MSLSTALALLALLLGAVAVLGVVAVYGRVRELEAGAALGLSGYDGPASRTAPPTVRPRPGQSVSIVAVLDSDCALCRTVWDELRPLAGPVIRVVGVLDRAVSEFADGGRAELLADVQLRGDLFEGYSPTVLIVEADGRIRGRRFVYPDTSLRAVLHEMLPTPSGRQ